jgi:hypothetical protein
MPVPFGINWERLVSDGTVVCSKCKGAISVGESIDVRLDGYEGDPTVFCTPCVTPKAA